jgi:UrcA family protein
MKTLLAFAPLFALATVVAAPVAAQTMPMIIPMSASKAPLAPRAERTLEQRLVAAAQAACGRPHLANLRGQELYRACVAEVTNELTARYMPAEGTRMASAR